MWPGHSTAPYKDSNGKGCAQADPPSSASAWFSQPSRSKVRRRVFFASSSEALCFGVTPCTSPACGETKLWDVPGIWVSEHRPFLQPRAILRGFVSPRLAASPEQHGPAAVILGHWAMRQTVTRRKTSATFCATSVYTGKLDIHTISYYHG